jgi:preprotein translocase subunit YajC
MINDIIMTLVGIAGACGFAWFLLQRDERKKQMELKERELAIEEAKLKRKQ